MKFNGRYDERVQELMDLYGVSWLRFDDSTNGVFDSVTNSINGTLYGNPTRVIGWNGVGKALNFNGSGQYVLMNAPIIPYGEKTVRIKFKYTRTTNPTSENRIYATSTGANTGLVLDLMKGDCLRILLFNGGTALINEWYYPDDFNMFRNQFNTFHLSIDSKGVFRAYMNDEQFVEKQLPSNYDTVKNSSVLTFSTNAGATSVGSHFGGIIDSFEVYNKHIPIEMFDVNYSLINHENKYLTYTNRITSPITSRIVVGDKTLQYHTIDYDDLKDLEEYHD